MENNATYYSLIAATRAVPDNLRPNIAWGHGGQVSSSIASATVLEPFPITIRYLGDLDPAGLQIPVNANTTARNAGLPDVRPATALYQWLLDHGAPQPSKSAVTRAVPDPVLAWLPPSLREPIADLVGSGHRIAKRPWGLRL